MLLSTVAMKDFKVSAFLRRVVRLSRCAILACALTLLVPTPAHAQEAWTAEAIMGALVKGALSKGAGTFVGWTMGLAGFGTDATLSEIEDELEQIEEDLEQIEEDLSILIEEVAQLTCDTAIQNARDPVNAIKNLWSPNALSAAPGDFSLEYGYTDLVGYVADGTASLDDIQTWVNRVLNIGGQGINQQDVREHLQDLGGALIADVGDGIITACLVVPSNNPDQFDSQTDDAYYTAKVESILNYYYTIQVQGLLMEVGALHFQAWLAAGSPQVDTDDPDAINDIAIEICGNPPNDDVQKICDFADNVVFGEDGISGVRGRVRTQLKLGGAPYTNDNVHRYMGTGGSVLFASSIQAFTDENQPGCGTLTSNAPCGPTVGDFNLELIDGTFDDRTGWTAAYWDDLQKISAPGYDSSYDNFADWLNSERGFDLAPNLVIITPTRFLLRYEFTGSSAEAHVICFMETGAVPGRMHHWYCDNNNSYQPNLLPNVIQGDRCGVQGNIPYYFLLYQSGEKTPDPSLNANFYAPAELAWNRCSKDSAWTAPAPGWSTAGSPDHPQFHLPVIDLDFLTCDADPEHPDLEYNKHNPAGAPTMCGDDLTRWLNARVGEMPDAASLAVTRGDQDVLRGHGEWFGDLEIEADESGFESARGDGWLVDADGVEADIQFHIRRHVTKRRTFYTGYLQVSHDDLQTVSNLRIDDIEVTHLAHNAARFQWPQNRNGLVFTLTLRDFAPIQ